MKRWLFLRGPVAAILVVAGAAVPTGPTASVSAAAVQCTLCGGGEFHSVAPVRVFDSRPAPPGNPEGINDVAPAGRKNIGPGAAPATFDLNLLGLLDAAGGALPVGSYQNPWLPSDVQKGDVLAVVASIVIVSPSRAGYLAAYPVGAPSTSSVLNFGVGQTVANLAIVRPDDDGWLTVAIGGTSSGLADVVIDVYGWFSTSAYDAGTPFDENAPNNGNQDDERGARLIPVGPGRLLDTRISGGGGALGQRSTRQLQIRGADTVVNPLIADIVPGPANNADVVGVVLNVTAITPSLDTFLSVLPEEPTSSPTTSNVNVLAGGVKANTVIVPVGDDGSIWLYNLQGNTHVVVDVVGYLRTGDVETTRAGRVVPLSSPFRVFDTRQVPFGAVPLGPGQAEDWSFADFTGSVNIGGIPVGEQSALIGNLTSASLSRQYPTVPVAGYLVTYPKQTTPGAPPTVSNLNSVEEVPVPNLALVKYGASKVVTVYNRIGYAHYLLDVSAVVLAD